MTDPGLEIQYTVYPQDKWTEQHVPYYFISVSVFCIKNWTVKNWHVNWPTRVKHSTKQDQSAGTACALHLPLWYSAGSGS